MKYRVRILTIHVASLLCMHIKQIQFHPRHISIWMCVVCCSRERERKVLEKVSCLKSACPKSQFAIWMRSKLLFLLIRMLGPPARTVQFLNILFIRRAGSSGQHPHMQHPYSSSSTWCSCSAFTILLSLFRLDCYLSYRLYNTQHITWTSVFQHNTDNEFVSSAPPHFIRFIHMHDSNVTQAECWIQLDKHFPCANNSTIVTHTLVHSHSPPDVRWRPDLKSSVLFNQLKFLL